MLSSHLRIGTFNLLAPCYNRLRFQEQPTFLEPSKVIVQKLDNESENHLYTFLESVTPARYKSRTLELLSSVISKMECDVMCFQEFWMTKEMKDMFENYLIKEKHLFDASFYAKRTRGKEDGVAIFVNESKYHVECSKEIVFHDVGDRIALMLHLKHKSPTNPHVIEKSPQIIKQSTTTSPLLVGTEKKLNDIILVNTHLTFPHTSFDETFLRPEQIQKITSFVKKYLTDLYTDPRVDKDDLMEAAENCGYGGACTVSQLPPLATLPATFNCFIAGDMNTRLFPQCPTSICGTKTNPIASPHYFISAPSSNLTLGAEDPVLKHLEEEGFTSCFHSYFGHHNFVSHHNHLDEEVGADFIFHGTYTVEEVPSPTRKGYDNGLGGRETKIVKNPPSSHKDILTTVPKPLVEQKTQNFTPKNSTEDVSVTSICKVDIEPEDYYCCPTKDEYPIKIKQACLLPNTKDDVDFPKEFLYLSDHRPLFVDVEFKS